MTAQQPRKDHTGYIKSCLEVLKNDKKAIFTAAGYAEKTVAYLFNLRGPGASQKPCNAIIEGAPATLR